MKVPLEQLHDILPGPDTGIIDNLNLVASVLLVFILTICFLYRIHHTWPRYRIFRQARHELNVIAKNHHTNYIPAVNALLKKTASNYWKREDFAGLYTQDWLKFLDDSSSCHFSKYSDKWENWSYSGSEISEQERKEVLHECRKWLSSNRNRRPL